MLFRRAFAIQSRAFSSSAKNQFKVAVLGASGGIGQPMSLLLKQNPLITRLSLYDIVGTKGIGADLSHIDTPAKIEAFVGPTELDAALVDAEVVVIPAGVPRKPGMTRDDLFKTNASIVKSLAEACAKNCPKARILVIANPVNSTVPIIAEVFKKQGVFDERKLFGVTTLDILRANTFVREINGWSAKHLNVKVIGGHSGDTIVPLLSQVIPKGFPQDKLDALTHRIQFGGDEVVKAKAGTGSATLSMAVAGARFTNSVLEALSGNTSVIDIAYVFHGALKAKDDIAHPAYFASEIKLNADGVETIFPVKNLTEFEKKLLAKAIPELESNIAKGIDFVAQN